MKKTLTLISLTVAAVAAMAGPASAHTPTVTSSCSTLTVELRWYEPGSHVTVTVDGDTTTATFDGDYTETYTGKSAWTVDVDNNGDGYDSHHTGRFVDCTPPTTVPSTTTVIELPTPVAVPKLTAVFGNDCDTRSAWVQFDNTGTADDRVSVAGRLVDVPANGLARVNLQAYTDTEFFYAPISSLVTNTPVEVRNAPAVDSTGLAHATCTYLDIAVLDRQVVDQPTVLAFTGARSEAMAAAGVSAIVVGAALVALGRRRTATA